MAIQIPAHRPEAKPAHPLPAQAVAGKQGSSASASALQAQQKANFNSAVVQSTLSVALQSGDEPLSLMLRSVIESLNEVLEPELGPNAIQNAMDQDNSPEATAQRIVSMSTGFFTAFREQHPEYDEATALSRFMETIRSGFEQGFAEAQEILEGLGVLDNVAEDINRTYDLVVQGYADFESGFGAADSAQSAD